MERLIIVFFALGLIPFTFACTNPGSRTNGNNQSASVRTKDEQFKNIEKGMSRTNVYSVIARLTAINPKKVIGLDSAYSGLKTTGATIEQWLYRNGRGFAELVVAFSPEGRGLAVSRSHRAATK